MEHHSWWSDCLCRIVADCQSTCWVNVLGTMGRADTTECVQWPFHFLPCLPTKPVKIHYSSTGFFNRCPNSITGHPLPIPVLEVIDILSQQTAANNKQHSDFNYFFRWSVHTKSSNWWQRLPHNQGQLRVQCFDQGPFIGSFEEF